MQGPPHRRGGDFSHPLNIFTLLSVCHDKQNLLPGLFERLRQHTVHSDLPAWTYIKLHDSNLKFYIEGHLIGKYDRQRNLRQVLFLFRNTEEEVTRKLILDKAMAQTRIFPWFFDSEHHKMIIDTRWYTHLGIPAGDGTISTGEFFNLVHPDDREMLLGAFTQQLSGQINPGLSVYRIRRGDGTWEWFEEQSVYLGQADSVAPYRIVGIRQSIHDHKTSEDELRKARDKARESDRLKSAFLANMSHEIRTPLNAIIGFANLLTDTEIPFSEEEKQEYSRLITTNGDQLLRLISDILDLSKIESNTMEFHFEEHSLHSLLGDIYQAQKLNMHPNVELRLELPEDDPGIYTDASRLKQVINNLINNAVKFTDSGSITFGYRLPQACPQIELFVKDTGKGIGREHLERIFERFYKADLFVKGVGLGLSICRTIAESLGGGISVASQPDDGTCFTVVHPLHKAGTKPRPLHAQTAGELK